MSDNKFQPGEEMFDEVAGHGFRGNVVDEDDAEGHAIKSGRALPEDEDAEGHAIRSGRALPEDDDTEGHGVRIRF
jgi:hypothetical protein